MSKLDSSFSHFGLHSLSFGLHILVGLHAVASRSTIFDRKLKLDIGLQDFKSSGLSIGFFRRGLTTASFRFARTSCQQNIYTYTLHFGPVNHVYCV